MEDLGELPPLVQILDLPVPQMVDNVLDALRIPERQMAVQVIEVPKFLIDVIPARSLVPEPQTAEQLVKVDFPVQGGGGLRGGLQGPGPGQGSIVRVEYISSAPAVFHSPASVVESFTSAPAVIQSPAPVVESFSPAPAILSSTSACG